jgi:GTP-binding protein HflX
VGFIKKLPHDLVASFKSTLDEAKEATLLLHVVDASDPTFESQYAVTREVLAEIGASDVPANLVLNKCDCISPEERARLERAYPDAFFCSARSPEDVARLRTHIISFFEDRYVEASVVVPYDRQAAVARMHEEAKVVSQDYQDDGVHVVLRGDAETVARLRKGLEA